MYAWGNEAMIILTVYKCVRMVRDIPIASNPNTIPRSHESFVPPQIFIFPLVLMTSWIQYKAFVFETYIAIRVNLTPPNAMRPLGCLSDISFRTPCIRVVCV